MPTPVGHALAGLAIGWFSEAMGKKNAAPIRRPALGRLTLACIAAAVVADADILFGQHRTYSHSIGAVFLAGVIAWLIARRRGHRPVAIAFTIAVAYATHLLLDWLARDTAPPLGLMALWPFSSRFYVSGANLFFEVSRRYWKADEFILGNLKAIGWEIVMLAPVAAFVWWIRSTSFDA